MKPCLLLFAMVVVVAVVPTMASARAEAPCGGRDNDAVASAGRGAVPGGILDAAINREAARLAGEYATTGEWSGAAQATPRSGRSWIKRHPVLSGAIIGAAIGTAVAAAAWGSEGGFVGFYSGAAVGAVVGAVAR